MKVLSYLKSRLAERSTWIAIGGGIAAAAALAHPWSYIAFGVGAIAALVPDGNVKPGG